MGEYGKRKSDGKAIKIGTCEANYYVRLEDKDKVTPDENSGFGYYWRLPFPNEDNIPIGEYKDHARGERLFQDVNFSDASTAEDPGTVQLTHKCGLLLNVKCYHGEKLPAQTDEMKPFWNGKSWFFELIHLRTTDDGKVHPIVGCRHCCQMWRYTWDEILPWIQDAELRTRLEKYR